MFYWPLPEQNSSYVPLTNISTILPPRQELKQLKDQPPEDPVAALQEELAASKVREAEAVSSLKELQQTVADLNVMWKRHLEVGVDCGVDRDMWNREMGVDRDRTALRMRRDWRT